MAKPTDERDRDFDGADTIDERSMPAALAPRGQSEHAVPPEEEETSRWAGHRLFSTADVEPRGGPGRGRQTGQMVGSGEELADTQPDRRRSPSVELAGAEAEAARLLAEAEAAQRQAAEADVDVGQHSDPMATQVVERRGWARLTHECRLCGQRIGAPERLRVRRPVDAGFRCSRCGNVYCHAHVVCTSGWASALIRGASFCCALCLPEKAE